MTMNMESVPCFNDHGSNSDVDDSEEEFCRALCILFLPFRNEIIDLHSRNPISLYEDNKAKKNSTEANLKNINTLLKK